MPRIIPIGDGAENYIGTALALYRKGKKGQYAVDNAAVILIGRDIKIVMVSSAYALFQLDLTTRHFLPLFQDSVPVAWPTFPTTPLPGMPIFFPAYPAELLAPAYDHFDVYDPGDSAPYFTLPFMAPILSYHSEGLAWYAAMLNPNFDTDNFWYLTKYQLTGYVNPYDNPMSSKMILSDGETNLWEYDISAPNVVCAWETQLSGVNYRRLKDSGGTKIIAALQDGGSYSGALSEVLEDSGTLYFSPLALAPLPAGSRGTSANGYTEHVDWVIDIFTSERAQHYYIVIFCADNSIGYYGQDWVHVNDIQFFPGMSLTVEKRKKSDLSLVQTYNLTPSAVDLTLQDVSIDTYQANLVNQGTLMLNKAFGGGGVPLASIQTRFAPYGIGGVLVDAAGNEYPVLVCIECTQDLFSPGTDAPRSDYVAGNISALTYNGYTAAHMNVFQQTAVLWLGGGGAGYTWPGVDALGLEGVGGTSQLGTGIADSDNMMLQLQPLPNSTTQQIVTVNLQGGVPTAQIAHTQDISQPFYMYDI